MPPDRRDRRRNDDPRKDLRHFADMIAYAEDAIAFMDGCTAADLAENRMLQYAVIRAIEVIGEASRNVSEFNVRRWSTIPWPMMYGMRNRLAHDYGGVEPDIVYRVATTHLPALLIQLRQAMSALQTEYGQVDQ